MKLYGNFFFTVGIAVTRFPTISPHLVFNGDLINVDKLHYYYYIMILCPPQPTEYQYFEFKTCTSCLCLPSAH